MHEVSARLRFSAVIGQRIPYTQHTGTRGVDDFLRSQIRNATPLGNNDSFDCFSFSAFLSWAYSYNLENYPSFFYKHNHSKVHLLQKWQGSELTRVVSKKYIYQQTMYNLTFSYSFILCQNINVKEYNS